MHAMVDFGKLANKAKQALSQHSDKVTGGIDKAAGFAKEKFKGKAEAIENVAEKAKGFVAGQSGKGDARPTDEAGGGGHSSKGASDHGSAGRGPGSPQGSDTPSTGRGPGSPQGSSTSSTSHRPGSATADDQPSTTGRGPGSPQGSDTSSTGRGPGSPQEGKGSSSPGKSDRESAGDQNTYRWD
ncbi:Rv0909 family putative TA system antitoxin [Thermocrispum sp.]|uniref:antitoxin n=1 Tax=Thermocrispum sp. TaxID=2060768 RepID=UPI00257A7414|nr:Rv0909 family putative TA system antitoxin [Thermocrispum sp.]